jgi:hypothetical protein
VRIFFTILFDSLQKKLSATTLSLPFLSQKIRFSGTATDRPFFLVRNCPEEMKMEDVPGGGHQRHRMAIFASLLLPLLSLCCCCGLLFVFVFVFVVVFVVAAACVLLLGRQLPVALHRLSRKVFRASHKCDLNFARFDQKRKNRGF